jgi:NAD-dependent SIR2 family protein deacetylase
LEEAAVLTMQADLLIVVGTSLQVYPAAGLIHYRRQGVPLYFVDPNPRPKSECRRSGPSGNSPGAGSLGASYFGESPNL